LAHWWSQVPTVVPGEMLSYAVKAGSYFSIVFTYDDPESEMQVWKGDILYSIIYILLPIGSMYGIYANIGGILMVNVTI